MKEILIIVISIILVVVGGNIAYGYIEKTSNNLQEKITLAKEEIKKAKTNQQNQAIEITSDLFNEWQNLKDKWALLIIHDELDLIDLSIIEVKTSIEEEDFKNGMEEIEKLSFLLEHIKEKDKLSIMNLV